MGRAYYICIILAAAATPLFGSDPLRVVPLETPASAGSMTPHLASSRDGLYLSWLERTDTGHAMKLSRWSEAGFGDPKAIHASDRVFANWADFGSVLPLGDGRLVAHWLEKAAEGTYEYDIWISISDDDGRSWSEPERPHRDGTLSEHGFVSMVPQGASGFAAVWLDGRQFETGASDNEMTLQFTTFDGVFGEEALLDARVCECCQTGMAETADGLFVAYRDRSQEEIRDISYVRRVEGRWSEPATLHADDWHLTGCPVNGPQVAADGRRVAVAWFTASGGTPRVQVAFSEDAGASFAEPVRVDDGEPVGRVDLEWLGDDAVVTWVERIEGRNGELRLKRMSPNDGAGSSITVATTGSGRASGFARMARVNDWGGELFLSWTEAYARGGPSQVRLARVVEDVALLDEPALNFTATGTDGQRYDLETLSGNVVVLNFWGIWCVKCRDEIPLLAELDREHRSSGLVVLGADYGDEPKDLPAFAEEYGMDYPVLVDDGLADDYGIIVYPTSVVIDRSGRVRYRAEGFTRESFRTMERVVETLLTES